MKTLTKEDIKLKDVLVYKDEIFHSLKYDIEFNTYVVRETRKTSIICDIVKYKDPHANVRWTQIPLDYIENYVKIEDIIKNYPQYFI
jgi:hypothetical protein